MPDVHPTAVVDPGAVLAGDVRIGPLCYVGEGVELGEGTELIAQATVLGPARLGANNRVFPGAVLGAPPQDRTYQGEPTRLEVGDENLFREQVTVHRGTTKGDGTTRVGSRCLFMVGAHVAHDCAIGDNVVLVNLATLGGHVRIGDGAVVGGHAAIAPFVHVGRMCFLAGGAMVEDSVPPFVIVSGDRARVRAVNRVGLSRNGVPDASKRAIERAFRMLYRSGQPRALALAAAGPELAADPYVAELIAFLREH